MWSVLRDLVNRTKVREGRPSREEQKPEVNKDKTCCLWAFEQMGLAGQEAMTRRKRAAGPQEARGARRG